MIVAETEKSGMNKPEMKILEMKILGMKLPIYLLVLAITVACMLFGVVPNNMLPAFFVLMVLGEGLNTIGKTVPIIKTYLGGSVICILGGAIIAATGLIPQQTMETMDHFVNSSGFLTFYIAALITGSLFNIDRNLLLRATVKLLPVALLSLLAGEIVSGILGMIQGQSFLEGILYIGIPMTSGGMTAGAVPLSSIYSQTLGGDAGEILTRISPATVLGNVIAIIWGSLLNKFGRDHSKYTGYGVLVNDGIPVEKPKAFKPSFQSLCTGMVISFAFYQAGALMHHFITIVPTYAWMIILVVLIKGTGIMSEELEDGAREWGQLAIHSWTAAALAGIGFTLIDLKAIMKNMTPLYLISCILIVTTIMMVAWFLGSKVGFYPLESAIAAGLSTTNMGGSGNVAILSSAERMELLPFAQIVTRSCGALMLTMGGILIGLLK